MRPTQEQIDYGARLGVVPVTDSPFCHLCKLQPDGAKCTPAPCERSEQSPSVRYVTPLAMRSCEDIQCRELVDGKCGLDGPCKVRDGHEHDTEGTQYPTCPRCGYEDPCWYEGRLVREGLAHDGDSVNFECGNCGNEYKLTICIEYTFNSDEKESTT